MTTTTDAMSAGTLLAVGATAARAAEMFAGLGGDVQVCTADAFDAGSVAPLLAATDPRTPVVVGLTADAANGDSLALGARLAAERPGSLVLLELAEVLDPERLAADVRTAGLHPSHVRELSGRPFLVLDDADRGWDPLESLLRSSRGPAPVRYAARRVAARPETETRTNRQSTPEPTGGGGRGRRRPTGPPAPASPPAPAGLPARLAGLVGLRSHRGATAALGAAAVLGVVAVVLVVAATLSDGFLGLLVALGLVAVTAVGALVLRLVQVQARVLRAVQVDVPADLRRLGDVDRRVRALDRTVGGLDRRVARTQQLTREVRRHQRKGPPLATARQVRAEGNRILAQTQAFERLARAVDLPTTLPALGTWVASPDLLTTLVQEMQRSRPRHVVETGSGVSTLVLALTAQQHDIPCRIVALEHDRAYARQTRALLAENGVAHLAEVRFAPLERTTLPDHPTPWYSHDAVTDLRDIDLVLIDGPPDATGPDARYPFVPLLRDALSPRCVLVADDTIRPGDRAVVERWHRTLPDFDLVDIPLEKGATVLRRRTSAQDADR